MTETFAHGYALLIGVGEFEYKQLNSLPVTSQDTQTISQILKAPELCGYPENLIRTLNNQAATYSKIVENLIWLKKQAKADPEATIFIYYSGHGQDLRKKSIFSIL